jgi:hypothetical protein
MSYIWCASVLWPKRSKKVIEKKAEKKCRLLDKQIKCYNLHDFENDIHAGMHSR